MLGFKQSQIKKSGEDESGDYDGHKFLK